MHAHTHTHTHAHTYTFTQKQTHTIHTLHSNTYTHNSHVHTSTYTHVFTHTYTLIQNTHIYTLHIQYTHYTHTTLTHKQPSHHIHTPPHIQAHTFTLGTHFAKHVYSHYSLSTIVIGTYLASFELKAGNVGIPKKVRGIYFMFISS